MRVLIAGDIHIGRTSSKVTADPDVLRARSAWQRIVDLALQERVDLVLLSGDITDRNNKYWEAIGPLERDTKQLGKAGIETVAVSGNHDFDVLARLASDLPQEQFRLLGRGGEWERYTLHHDNQPILHVDGWSFPTEHVSVSPLTSYPNLGDDGQPIIGLVHGDLGQSSSRYAPLDRVALQTSRVDAWVLGHLHTKQLVTAEDCPWILYPGSPQALDPGEAGEHGVWLLEIRNGSVSIPEFRPLSTVWYGECEVDVSGLSERSDFESAIVQRVRLKAAGIAEVMGPALGSISLRLTISGATSLAAEAATIVSDIEEDLEVTVQDAAVTIDTVKLEVTPPIDIVGLVRTSSAIGLVAKMLVDLDGNEPSEQLQQLIDEILSALRSNDRKFHFRPLEDERVTHQACKRIIHQQAKSILNQLAAQTE